MGKLYVPAAAAAFDEHRNTSRVWPVEPGALDHHRAAVAAYRRSHPEVFAYMEAGSPPILSQADHVRWFGVLYDSKRKR